MSQLVGPFRGHYGPEIGQGGGEACAAGARGHVPWPWKTGGSPWVHHEKTQLNDEELFFQDETLLWLGFHRENTMNNYDLIMNNDDLTMKTP